MILNTTINDVPVVIEPAVVTNSGPSGRPAQIQSQDGTGPSRAITINFDEQPVKSFSVGIVGPSYAGNAVIAYDRDGGVIKRVPVTQVFDNIVGGEVTVRITAPDGMQPISRIVLIPAPNDYVAYNNLRVSVDGVIPQDPFADVQPTAPPQTGAWYEERFYNTPTRIGLAQVLGQQPVSTRNIATIQYPNGSLTLESPCTFRWTRTDIWEDGRLEFNGSSDDGIRILVDDKVVVDQFTNHPPQPFFGFIDIKGGSHKITVLYFNDILTGEAIVNVGFKKLGQIIQPPDISPILPAPPTQIPPPIYTPIPQPPPLPPPDVIAINDIVQFTEATVNRTYRKDTLSPIPQHIVGVTNRSDVYNVWLELSSVEGVTLTPRSFLLEKKSSRDIVLTFDPVKINNYPEGLSRATLPMRITSKAIITVPEYVAPPIVPSYPPLVQVPAVQVSEVPAPQPAPPAVPVGGPTQIPRQEVIPPTPQPPVINWPPAEEIVPIPRVPDLPPPPPPRDEPTEPQNVWVSGYAGGLNFGYPPAGWVQDPYGGCWYRPDDPFVLNNFGRGTPQPPVVETLPPEELAPPPTATPVPPTPPPVILPIPPQFIPDEFVPPTQEIIPRSGIPENPFSGGSGGGSGDVRFTPNDNGVVFNDENQINAI